MLPILQYFQNAATPFEEEIDLPSAKSKEITQRWEAHMHYFHHCLTCEMRSGLFATDCLVEGLPKVHSRLVDRDGFGKILLHFVPVRDSAFEHLELKRGCSWGS